MPPVRAARSGSSFLGGNSFAALVRTLAVHMPASPGSAAAAAAAGSSAMSSAGSSPPAGCGKRNSKAAPKITTITAMTIRLATEMSMNDQCR